MPFPMRIQPIDSIRSDLVKPPVLKSRLKRLFDRPFNGVLRISSAAEKTVAGGEKDGGEAAAEFEPNSVCLDKMVQSFIEGNNEKQSSVAARNRCNCFNGNSNDSSDDDLDFFSDSVSGISPFSDPSDALKSLIPCESITERNLLVETSRIVDTHSKIVKRKDDLKKLIAGDLVALGYDAAVCKSRWEKTPSIPAGEYEYIDVMVEGERVLIDVDFRSEFEIARSTSGYRAVLQCLPYIFVGKTDRLVEIVAVASEAARVSLKKKGMHIAPWRKPEYVKSKWVGPHTRVKQHDEARPETETDSVSESEVGELDLIFGEKDEAVPEMTWQLPAVRPKRGSKAVVTGLASLLKEKL